MAKRVLIYNKMAEERQKIYEEFVLDYVLTHPRCTQFDIFNGLRRIYVDIGEEDPGITALRNSIESLIKQRRLRATRTNSPSNSATRLFLAS